MYVNPDCICDNLADGTLMVVKCCYVRLTVTCLKLLLYGVVNCVKYMIYVNYVNYMTYMYCVLLCENIWSTRIGVYPGRVTLQ